MSTQAAASDQFKELQTKNGSIRYSPEDVYVFPQGIIGYEIWKRYLLLPVPGVAEDSPYMLLQSIDNKDLSFILMQIIVEDQEDYEEEPIIFYKDIKPCFDDANMELSSSAVLLVISIEVKNNQQIVSANLAGPIIMDPSLRTGKQVILEDDRYEAKKIINVVEKK